MKQEIIDKLNVLITSGFGLVAALAWNDAIQSLFKEEGVLFFLAAGGKWLYAILVTVIAVALTMWIGRLATRATRKKEEKEQKTAKKK